MMDDGQINSQRGINQTGFLHLVDRDADAKILGVSGGVLARYWLSDISFVANISIVVILTGMSIPA